MVEKRYSRSWLIPVAMLALTACGPAEQDSDLPPIQQTNNGPQTNGAQPDPVEGETDFVSADGYNGQESQDNRDSANNGTSGAPDEFGADAEADDRSVEEGDIYRVASSEGLILNLNSYRGLQIIDFSDVSAPEIIGHVRVSGTPVEMYSVGDRVFILLNNWRGYYGSRDDIVPDTYEGGVVLAVDVSNPAQPQVTGRAEVPGWIRTSRLTRGDGKEALYVVASDGQTTHVKSFKVSSTGTLAEKTQIDLGGYVSDIQATGSRLLVARYDWSWRQQNQGSQVSIIDISDPDGEMVEGDTITVKGRVAKKTDMDLHDDVLRIVSGNDWSNTTNTNHLETFDASDMHNLQPIDHDTFGDGDNLFATIFLGEKAFFVTYRRVDPFHAFEITADGQATEKSEFIVSGWNDWFKPVAQQTRLIGIGKNDENGVTMAVSLYDITDLTNPNPLIEREEIDLRWSHSEANWDDRAFSVLEKGTSVYAEDGTTLETGLVLLPFNGWDDQAQEYVSGVQIFTFSDTTLTKRGVMTQATPVRRSFVADRTNSTTGNLSETELSLFDTTDPDAPSELSRLELAPNYTNFFVFGDYGVRRHDNHAYYYWWGNRGNTTRTDTLQIVSRSQDVDRADAIAEIEVPSHAQLYKQGDRLISVAAEYLGTSDANDQPEFETQIDVWDLTNPTMPVHLSNLVTEDLPPAYYYYGGYYDDCFNCSGYYYQPAQNVKVVDDALVFVETIPQRELEGTEHIEYSYPQHNHRRWESCYDNDGQPKACTYFTGHRSCRQLTRVDGTQEAKVCSGAFYECTQSEDGTTDCEETELTSSQIERHEYTHERYRHWQQYNLHVVDLSDASNPALATVVTSAQDEEAVNLLVRGDDLYLTYKKPFDVPGDSRPYVKYFFRPIDFSNPSSPQAGADVNIPGELLEIDGNTLITRNYLWGETIVEASINRLELQDDLAYLQGTHRFVDKQVMNVLLDGLGHVLVSHQTAWRVNRAETGYGNYNDWDRTTRLAVLDLNSSSFAKKSEVDIDDWARLQTTVAGRALFRVPGGMLVMNLDDAANPHAQAYFPLRGWPRDFQIDGDTVYFAAGPFGLYTFDTTESNLLTQ